MRSAGCLNFPNLYFALSVFKDFWFYFTHLHFGITEFVELEMGHGKTVDRCRHMICRESLFIWAGHGRVGCMTRTRLAKAYYARSLLRRSVRVV